MARLNVRLVHAPEMQPIHSPSLLCAMYTTPASEGKGEGKVEVKVQVKVEVKVKVASEGTGEEKVEVKVQVKVVSW